ncbi:peptide N-acetyl-beta-D-glucosaminyl asparaginase amidase A-domain-containing protein [Blyttiomyces helicus]|uniref:Peptide N-acetyl-beta-D-glucosaminyl asparaginase amidase A-domain-containing protein n=1 Tax=Blyttiomyces helicus TaxID=388810 RepID=A0A4P9WPI6_9FUNG|nr:peptide N-acetyl-beta-D-glucosaminyl asparaginase amidase A-domain-containing protein [Blyttiomyces helicus]|eukprot:RKO93160.1 peptide N-acetyl-beta-D-glucosaminyl asparaginase amidase A-domain-containing protein [Blyttiomyces helicus]
MWPGTLFKEPWLKAATALFAQTTFFGKNHTEYFEIATPIPRPNTVSCTVTLGTHSFGWSYGRPYTGTYEPPPPACDSKWSRVVLEFEAHVAGRQFDRFGKEDGSGDAGFAVLCRMKGGGRRSFHHFYGGRWGGGTVIDTTHACAIWIGGAEIMRLTTAEPEPHGVFWKVEKDITAYAPLLSSPQSVVIALDNIVDSTYTGIFNVTARAVFYAATEKFPVPKSVPHSVIPLSASNRTHGWFRLPQADHSSVTVPLPLLPQNIVKAHLEVFWSPHGCDEFW